MAILLRQLCEKASYLYGMRILAGENGTGNIVQWIHTLEDVETGGFIHGGELIFTTGIAQEGNEWLLEFVENLYEREATGFHILQRMNPLHNISSPVLTGQNPHSVQITCFLT